ncbi:hypothetical protein QO058_06005 [Bosea vestrisii]|uniref:hypothetical protein n=1 Tax=Bosea vestrisii TaxID=151416 RepID=UPI0024DFE7D3|nr:hypothetical protein [Bosea vestrisii]WID97801.1 hypothetical protein QO058_06005 [Bosea vestrisii]
MSVRSLKLLHDAGWILTILPLALMSFERIYTPWLLIANFIGCGMIIFAFVITRKTPEARLNDELIQNETREYYLQGVLSKVSLAAYCKMFTRFIWIISADYQRIFYFTDSQVIYIALLLWYTPHMIGNAFFGGRRALRIKSPQRVGGQ